MDTLGDSFAAVENNRAYIDKLYSSDPNACYEGVKQLKTAIIGSNRQKDLVIKNGIVPRLLNIISEDNCSPELLVETAVILGSLALGTTSNIEALIKASALPVLFMGIFYSNDKYVTSCLRALRSIYKSGMAPISTIYNDPETIPQLIHLANSTSVANQECVANIFAFSIANSTHQDHLCNLGLIDALAKLLTSNCELVQLPTMQCLAKLCHENEKVSSIAATTTYNGKSIPDILAFLMSRDKSSQMQLASAKCITNIFRAGSLAADDYRIVFRALPTLVRMCKKPTYLDEESEFFVSIPQFKDNLMDMIDGAETLSYLTEVDTELQRVASINDHLILTLSDFFKIRVTIESTRLQQDEADKLASRLKQAAFKAFASLGANDEEIRKKIIETDQLMLHIVVALTDPDQNCQLAAVRCLHSLSRSVQQLRTTFQDHAVWRPLMKILQTAEDEILTVASSTLCNLLLEFSPSKEPILECGAVKLLCELTKRDSPALKLNGVWALMNMAFQADQKVKAEILTSLGTDQVFRLLSEPDINVLMKTLGLLRNLLSSKPHIDHIMALHGNEIMQAVILILEGDNVADVKEQALCILANIADGIKAKDFIMANEDVLKKLATYMLHSNIKLQVAATFCVSNLIWNEEEGAALRQKKLKEIGIQNILQQLLTTNDNLLFDRVKSAVSQFDL